MITLSRCFWIREGKVIAATIPIIPSVIRTSASVKAAFLRFCRQKWQIKLIGIDRLWLPSEWRNLMSFRGNVAPEEAHRFNSNELLRQSLSMTWSINPNTNTLSLRSPSRSLFSLVGDHTKILSSDNKTAMKLTILRNALKINEGVLSKPPPPWLKSSHSLYFHKFLLSVYKYILSYFKI